MLFTILHLSPLLPLSLVSFSLPSHFLPSVASDAFMDGLSKCQVVTSATGIINNFLVSTTERETQGGREREGEVRGRLWWWRWWWWGGLPGLTLQFSSVSGSEEKEDDVRK